MGRKAKGHEEDKSKKEPETGSEPLQEAELLAGTGDQEPDISVFRPDREGVRKVLGDLEADIMEYIWDNVSPTGSGITVREVYEAFWQRRYIAYTTVMSTMARLARKHLLRARKVDNAYIYTPILSKAEFIDNFVSRILENLLVSFSYTTKVHLQRLSSGDKAGRIASLKNKVASLREIDTITSSKVSDEIRPAHSPGTGES